MKFISALGVIISFIAAIVAIFWFWQEPTLEPVVALIALGLSAIVGIVGSMKEVVELIDSWTNRISSKRIFISYPSEAQEQATEISNALKKSGIRVWIASEQLQAGQNINDAVQKAINQADVFLVLLNDRNSTWINRELEIAQEKNKRVIPVTLDNAQIPTQLQDIHHIQFGANKEKALKQIVDSIW